MPTLTPPLNATKQIQKTIPTRLKPPSKQSTLSYPKPIMKPAFKAQEKSVKIRYLEPYDEETREKMRCEIRLLNQVMTYVEEKRFERYLRQEEANKGSFGV